MSKKAATPEQYYSAILNTTRLRIVQYLALHEQGTAKEIRELLSDIPTATLYRHLKLLQDAGWIAVQAERTVRGTVEKSYGLARPAYTSSTTHSDTLAIIQTMLLSLLGSFQQYFTQKDADPVHDLLTCSTSSLLLTDQELQNLLNGISALVTPHLCNKPEPDRKPRRLTLISSPPETKSSRISQPKEVSHANDSESNENL